MNRSHALADGRPDAYRLVYRLLVFSLVFVCAMGAVGTATAAVERQSAHTTGVSDAIPGTTVSSTNATTEASEAALRSRIQDNECFSSGGPFTGEAGGLVEVSVDCTGYVVLGGAKEPGRPSNKNFLDILYVTGDFTINTRLLGTNGPDVSRGDVYDGSVESYLYDNGLNRKPSGTFSGVSFEPDGVTTLYDLRQKLGITHLPRPVRPERFQLVAANNGTIVIQDGSPVPKDPVDRQNIKLTKPEIDLGTLETRVAPPEEAPILTEDEAPIGNPSGVGTARDLVANGDLNDRVTIGDRVIVGGFSTDGLEGTLKYISGGKEDDYSQAEFQRLRRLPEGVNFTLRHTNPALNAPPERIPIDNSTSDGFEILYNDGEFYLVIDTGAEPFADSFDGGDEFEVRYAFESDSGKRFAFDNQGIGMPGPFEAAAVGSDRAEQYPYFEADETTRAVTTTFRVANPKISYDDVTDTGKILVANDGGVSVSGSTTLAPGTPMEMQLVSQSSSPPETVSIDELGLSADGSFEATAGSGGFDTGDTLAVEFYVRQQRIHTKEAIFVDDPSNPVQFDVTNQNDVTVSSGESLSDLTATIVNSGGLEGSQSIELRIQGETKSQQTVRLEPGQRDTINFADATIVRPPGEYEYTIASEDASVTGTIVVDERTPAPTTTSPPSSTTATTDSPATPEPTTVPETDSPPETTSPPERPDEPTSTPTPDSSSTPDDSDSGDEDSDDEALGFGLGVTTREALGGGMIVGGLYVLGYWA